MGQQRSFAARLMEQLSAEEALVWEVMQEHVGKANAITNHQLARETELQERLVS